jgi:hypothetical protein
MPNFRGRRFTRTRMRPDLGGARSKSKGYTFNYEAHEGRQ